MLIEQDEDGLYVASVPELEGCYTQAKSLETVRKRIREVISLILESDAEIATMKIRSPDVSPRFFGIEDIKISYA